MFGICGYYRLYVFINKCLGDTLGHFVGREAPVRPGGRTRDRGQCSEHSSLVNYLGTARDLWMEIRFELLHTCPPQSTASKVSRPMLFLVLVPPRC